jgi:hypothetical protein|tara:strand:- start:5273 stop:6010 length:738 start_codon:yes stop_codon:yes gene_type:complete
MAYDITKVAGMGTQNLDEGSAMPFIRILQDLSPQLKPNKDEYVEGSKAGDLFFAKTKDLLDNPVDMIPVYTTAMYTEWIPRNKGGGFVGSHPLSVVGNPSYEKGRERQYDEWLGDNELRYTSYWFVLINVNGAWEEAMIPFTSSQLKVSRKLTSDINRFRYEADTSIVPPLFAQKWQLATVMETSKNNDDYWNFEIKSPSVLDFESDEDLLELAATTSGKAADTPLLKSPKQDRQPALTTDEDIF